MPAAPDDGDLSLLEPDPGVRAFGDAAASSISYQSTKKPRRCVRSICAGTAAGCVLIGLATVLLVRGLVADDGASPAVPQPHASSTVPCGPCASGLCVRGGCVPNGESPLHYYVNNVTDAEYDWELVETIKLAGAHAHVLNLTSQRWLTERESDRSVWWHQLAVVVPDQPSAAALHTGWLWITGGHNDDDGTQRWDTTDSDFQIAYQLAISTRTICSVLKQVPNQPIRFTHEIPHPAGFYADGRTEDGIIAYTWNHFVSAPHDPEWLLRLPMTKAASRAMDAIQQFAGCNYCDSYASWQVDHPGSGKTWGPVNRFVVGGASKRGWTTWTTGIADHRVAAIVPVVMDLLNLLPNAAHFWAALGGWTFEFEDYVSAGFTSQLGNPNTQRMADVIDPYSYFKKDSPWAPSVEGTNFAAMPKLVVNAGNDEFCEKHFLMLPNADHPLGWHDVNGMGEGNGTKIFEEAALAFYSSVVGRGVGRGVHKKWVNDDRPTMTWQITHKDVGTEEESAYITVSNFSQAANGEPVLPTSVKMWHATTLDDKRRDWRLFDCVHEHGCTEMEAQPGAFPDAGPMPHPCVYQASAEVQRQSDPKWGVQYVAKMKRPANGGWTAFFLAFEFPGPKDSEVRLNGAIPNLHFTSEVAIVPTRMPFESCAPFGGAKCTDQLV